MDTTGWYTTKNCPLLQRDYVRINHWMEWASCFSNPYAMVEPIQRQVERNLIVFGPLLSLEIVNIKHGPCDHD